MFVIKIDSVYPAQGIAGYVNKIRDLDVPGILLAVGKVLLSVLVFYSVLEAGPAAALLKVPLKSIAQITLDDDSRPLSYAAFVFYDPVEEEIYVSNSSRGRVVVYGPDFFPSISIGRGRGVISPRGGLTMRNGEVYICQEHNRLNPRASITVLNGAFFPEREIFLDEIPEAADFTPNQLAISADGLIYLAGATSRGVLVLDNEGNFLRRLEPQDNIKTRREVEEATEEEKQAAEEDPLLADIPEEFRPKSSQKNDTSIFQEGLGPVKVNYVTIDSTGKLYLLSIETSKIYVYGPDEKFLFSFGEKGGTPRHLSQPKSLAIDEKRGLIYVDDYMRMTILVYDMTGKYLFEFGGRGTGPGWFNYPTWLAINKQGQLIVADLLNKRVQVLEVGYDELMSELGLASPSGSSPVASVASETASPEEPVFGQTGNVVDQEKASEAGISAGQGQPEEVGDQEKALVQPLEQPEPAGQMEGEQRGTPE